MDQSDYWDRNKQLIYWLVLPLAFLSIASLAIAWPFDPDAALVNVATDSISIVVTVLFVEWVLRRHEATEWEDSDKYSGAEVGQFAHGFISSVAQALYIEDQIIPPPPDPTDARDIQVSILRRAREFPREAFMQPLRNLSTPQWQILMDRIEAKRSEAAELLNLFSFRMQPSQVTLLLRFRAVVSGLLASYSMLRGFVGKPLAQLLIEQDEASRDYFEIQVIRTSLDLRLLLDICLNMIDEFEFHIGEPEIDYDEAMEEMWDPPWAIK